MSTNYMDYILADKILIPPEYQQFYSEKIAYLPHSYIIDDSKRVAYPKKFPKKECGLPEDVFVFCCFNNAYKFNPETIDSWAKILLATGESVIWISENNDAFKKNILSEFIMHHIDPSRVIFATRVNSLGDHLARYALADLFLDTQPYNAHTTALDSLKMGVPILTLPGQSFASRVTASLLTALDLTELITESREGYETLAIELANNPEQLSSIKLKLVENLSSTPLFNTTLSTKNIEAAYIKMYERYCSDLPHAHILEE